MSRQRTTMSAIAAAIGVILAISGMLVVGYFILVAIALSKASGSGK